LEHLRRMRVEGAGERLDGGGASPRYPGRQNRPVREVDAIEDSEGHRGGRSVRRVGLETLHDPHGESASA
jgi:hypothetical protein